MSIALRRGLDGPEHPFGAVPVLLWRSENAALLEQLARTALHVGVAVLRDIGEGPPSSSEKTDRAFAEPALFVINPHGQTQVVNVSNAPFARPELGALVDGLQTAQEEHAPIHGTAT